MMSLNDMAKRTVPALAGAFLAIVVLVLVGFATGFLTVQKIDTMVKVLRGEPGTRAFQERRPEELTGRSDMETLDDARRAVRVLREQEELLTVRLNERRGDMRRLEADAGRIRSELTDRARAVAAAERAFREERLGYAAQFGKAGFRRLVAALQDMSAKDAARLLYDCDVREAAELVKALDSDQRGRVIVEIGKRDRLGENAGKEGKAGKLMKLIGEGVPGGVTVKAE